MRLNKSRSSAEEEIIALQNKGYQLMQFLQSDYDNKKSSNSYDDSDHQEHKNLVNAWGAEVIDNLREIFPTELEANQFLHPPHAFGAISAGSTEEYHAKSLRIRLDDLIKGLDVIRRESLDRYTDLPIQDRLFIEDIDSFSKARDISHQMVTPHLRNGIYLDIPEDDVQRALEEMIGETFHKKDWAGEYNDLYSTLITVNGRRVPAAFMLKGRGLQNEEMRIRDCGANGDQLLRLSQSPAELWVVQFVGRVSEAVISDIAGKVRQRNLEGKQTRYCIIDGVDTARLLVAYGKLSFPEAP